MLRVAVLTSLIGLSAVLLGACRVPTDQTAQPAYAPYGTSNPFCGAVGNCLVTTPTKLGPHDENSD
jgi:hypothetical protein